MGSVKKAQRNVNHGKPGSYQSPQVLLNHVGFHPSAGKYVVVEGVDDADCFYVHNMQPQGSNSSFTGKLVRGGDDFGRYLVGNFSSFTEPGEYSISLSKSGMTSQNFVIGSKVLDEAIAKLVNYYCLQSCGASARGFNSPCHVEQIRRDDTGEFLEVSGGWHSAHDCCRTAFEILQGELGLIYLALARPDLEDNLHLFHELKWGNDYFLKIQDLSGYLYYGVIAPHYWDTKKYDWWDSNSYHINTEVAAAYLQHCFITTQALIAQHYKGRDPEYAMQCLNAGIRCLKYVQEHDIAETAHDFGSGVLAGVHMFRATAKEECRIFARQMARRLLALQTKDGFFHLSPTWAEKGWYAEYPARYHAVAAPLSVIGLCAAARWLPKDSDHPLWMAALRRFSDVYVKHFSEANSFGIIPYAIYPGEPPQKAHSWKKWHYRYFIETNWTFPGHYYGGAIGSWKTGSNSMVAGYGVAMVYLAEVLDLPWLRLLAQRQLDWVLGVNPFNASMVLGVGRNQPREYTSIELTPPVPHIEGAVLQGPIGDQNDKPTLPPGEAWSVEYWMPPQSWTLWLMAELSIDHLA